MSELKRPAIGETEEAPKSIKIQQQPLEKCEENFNDDNVKILDLPTEILEKIIGNMNIMDHRQLRATCTRLRNISDEYVMREFDKIFKKCLKENPKSIESSVLMAIKVCTEMYTHVGCKSIFCLCIPNVIQNVYKSQHTDFVLQCFLDDYYKSLTIVFEFKNYFIRGLTFLLIFPINKKWYDLLLNLAEVVKCNISGTPPNNVVNQYREPENLLSTYTLKLFGSKEIQNLFHSHVKEQGEGFHLLSEMPTDEFTLRLEIRTNNEDRPDYRYVEVIGINQ